MVHNFTKVAGRMAEMKKFLIASAMIAVSQILLSDNITVPSTYDEASGKWIGNIHALTNALHKSKSTQNTIYLSQGEYDVTSLTNAYMHTYKWDGGYAILYVGKAKVIGATGDPKDVVIKVDPSAEARIMIISGSGQLHGVTLTGGNASSKCNPDLKNYRIGGAVGFSGNGIVSNCVFYGNRSVRGGGAIGAQHGFTYGKVYDSVFYGNNNSAYGAIVACRTTLYNCVITNNVSPGLSNAGDEGYVTESCKIYDSYFADNVASLCGGAYGGCAVNCTFVNNRQHNPLAIPWNNAGGGAAFNAALTNCHFYGNVSLRLGGAIRGGNAYGCEIVSNRTTHATDAFGGGGYELTKVENCLVVSNYCAHMGGGLSHCAYVANSTISCNYAGNGGGVNGGAANIVTNCVITKNCSQMKDSEPGGGGGGVFGVKAINCTISDNSSAAHSAYLIGCDISSSRINAQLIDSCVIHDVANGVYTHAIGNVRHPKGTCVSNLWMIVLTGTMRNTLVTNCNWRSLPDSAYVNSALFGPHSLEGEYPARVENCTFADNGYYHTTRNFKRFDPNTSDKDQTSYDHPIAIVNSVFVRNRTSLGSSTLRDIETFDDPQLSFSNCVFGVVGNVTAKAHGHADSGNLTLGRNGKPKFVTWEDAPSYTPKALSPLRGMGLVLDWMADGADLAGSPRLRDGVVDVGCYQCWLNQPGLHVLLK